MRRLVVGQEDITMKNRKENVKCVINRHMGRLTLDELLMVLKFIYSLEDFA